MTMCERRLLPVAAGQADGRHLRPQDGPARRGPRPRPRDAQAPVRDRDHWLLGPGRTIQTEAASVEDAHPLRCDPRSGPTADSRRPRCRPIDTSSDSGRDARLDPRRRASSPTTSRTGQRRSTFPRPARSRRWRSSPSRSSVDRLPAAPRPPIRRSRGWRCVPATRPARRSRTSRSSSTVRRMPHSRRRIGDRRPRGHGSGDELKGWNHGDLIVSAPGFASTISEIGPVEGLRKVDVTLKRGTKVRLRVRDCDGQADRAGLHAVAPGLPGEAPEGRLVLCSPPRIPRDASRQPSGRPTSSTSAARRMATSPSTSGPTSPSRSTSVSATRTCCCYYEKGPVAASDLAGGVWDVVLPRPATLDVSLNSPRADGPNLSSQPATTA